MGFYNIDAARFASLTTSAANPTAQHLGTSVRGEFIRMSVQTNVTGSVYLFESGTNIPLTVLNCASGTNPTVVYPSRPVTDHTGAAITNAHAPAISLAPLYWLGSGFTSGTNNSVSYIEVVFKH